MTPHQRQDEGAGAREGTNSLSESTRLTLIVLVTSGCPGNPIISYFVHKYSPTINVLDFICFKLRKDIRKCDELRRSNFKCVSKCILNFLSLEIDHQGQYTGQTAFLNYENFKSHSKLKSKKFQII